MSAGPAVPSAVGTAPARAVARSPVPVRLARVARRGRLGRFRIGQLVTAELAVVAAVATYPQSDWVFVPVALAGAAVVAAAFVPREGRWWYEMAGLRWRFWRRRRAARTTPPDEDPRLAVLAPGLSVRDVADRNTRFGVGLDGAGWYAALAVSGATRSGGPDAPDDPAGAPPDLPADRLAQLLLDTDPPVTGWQVVHHVATVPAPAAAPAAHQVWVGLRLGAAQAPAAATARGGGLEGVHRTLAAAIGQVGKALRAAGLEHRPLIADELRAALAAVGGWTPAAPPDAAGQQPASERWRSWRIGDAAQVCLKLGGSSAPPLAGLIAALGQDPVRSFTVSVVRAPDPTGAPATHALLRIGAAAAQADRAADEVGELADRMGYEVRRLDGAHGPALYATAPTARSVG